MSAQDKATLQDFFESNFSLEFDWTHPLTSTVYTVFFVDDDIAFKHVKGSDNRWAVDITLGEA